MWGGTTTLPPPHRTKIFETWGGTWGGETPLYRGEIHVFPPHNFGHFWAALPPTDGGGAKFRQLPPIMIWGKGMFMFTDGGEQISVMGGNLTADGGEQRFENRLPPKVGGGYQELCID